MISIEQIGDTKNMDRFLVKMAKGDMFRALDHYAGVGVRALASVTPRDSGATAAAWYSEVRKSGKSYSITWLNSNDPGGFMVAIGLQYGHGTGTGGYVQGMDYINPAIRPIFQQIADDVWREVTSA